MVGIVTEKRGLKVSYQERSIVEIERLFDQLNFNPAFQRKSVWNKKDRKEFIHTVLEGMPCPTIFLYETWRNGDKYYDIIDGKQRFETIFLFLGKLSPKRLKLPPNKASELQKWCAKFNSKQVLHEQLQKFRDFKLPVGFISQPEQKDDFDDGIGDIITAFIRINTLGKPLVGAEKTSAQYFKSNIFKLADNLADNDKFHKILKISSEQKGRKKDIEVVIELLISLHEKKY